VLKPDEHDCRPNFRELRARLFEKGCIEEMQDVYPVAVGEVAPQEKYVVNRETGASICSEHWEDEEEVGAEFCDHVCRILGIELDGMSLTASDGTEVSIKPPAEKKSS